MLLHCCEEVLGNWGGKRLSSPHHCWWESIWSEKVWLARPLHRKTLCSHCVQYLLTLTASAVGERLSVSSPVWTAEHWERKPNATETIRHLSWLKSKLFWIVAVWRPGRHSIPKRSVSIKLMLISQHCQQCFSGSRGRLLGEREKWGIGATERTHKSRRAEKAQVEPLRVPSGNESLHSVYDIFRQLFFFFFFKRPGKLHGNKKRHRSKGIFDTCSQFLQFFLPRPVLF